MSESLLAENTVPAKGAVATGDLVAVVTAECTQVERHRVHPINNRLALLWRPAIIGTASLSRISLSIFSVSRRKGVLAPRATRGAVFSDGQGPGGRTTDGNRG